MQAGFPRRAGEDKDEIGSFRDLSVDSRAKPRVEHEGQAPGPGPQVEVCLHGGTGAREAGTRCPRRIRKAKPPRLQPGTEPGPFQAGRAVPPAQWLSSNQRPQPHVHRHRYQYKHPHLSRVLQNPHTNNRRSITARAGHARCRLWACALSSPKSQHSHSVPNELRACAVVSLEAKTCPPQGWAGAGACAHGHPCTV